MKPIQFPNIDLKKYNFIPKYPYFITFDGVDGCGKSTIISKFYDKLIENNWNPFIYAEKLNTLIQNKIFNKYKKSSELELLYWWTGRREVLEEFYFNQYLQNDQPINILLFDRYYDSTYVYQDLNNKLDNTSLLFNYNPNVFPIPNITFYLRVDYDVACSRMNSRSGSFDPNDPYENLSKIKEYISRYDQLFCSSDSVIRPYNNDHVIDVIDAEQSIDVIIDTVWDLFNKNFDKWLDGVC